MPPVVGALIAAGVTAGATFGTQVAIGAGIVVATKAAVAAFGVSLLASLTASRGGRGANQDTTQVVRASVLPARWIVGRARVGGQLVFYNEVNQDDYQASTPKPHSVNLALVLSEGSLDSIEKIWVNGEEINIESRTTDQDGVHLNLEEKWRGNIAVWEYFAADGTGGASLRAESMVESFDENLSPVAETLWTTRHKLTGKSWVHVKLIQNDYGEDTESRLWDRFPEINFLVKGIKITWPGQSTPTWTESAAAIRYWWLVDRCKIDPDLIDEESFVAAHNLCSQLVSYSVPSNYEGYSAQSIRYPITGVVTSEDDPDSISQEFDFCWQGYVVEADSKLYFRPGVERPVSRTLVEKDIITVEQVRTAPILQERINAMSMSIAQSSAKLWQNQDIPRQQDLEMQLERDNGQELWTNIGNRRFVSDPLTAARLLRIALRRVQSLSSYTYRVKPGQFIQWLSVIPGDWVQVENPSLGIEGVMFVVGVATNDDWSVTLVLQPQNLGVYSNPPLTNLLPNQPNPLAGPRVEVYHSDVHSDHGDVNSQHTNVHTNVNHFNTHTDVPTSHGDHNDGGAHTDAHSDTPGTHSNTHTDSGTGDHLDNHIDLPGNHADAHNDIPNSHVNTHHDGPHDDGHGDNAPETLHSDIGHIDNHIDLPGNHGDAHNDAPMGSHVDNHSDAPHDDVYTDNPPSHNNIHIDQTIGGHADSHLDDHMDGGENFGHDDQHMDQAENHSNAHTDFVEPHDDTHQDGHLDNHQDQGGTHLDSHHDDPSHTNVHHDITHLDHTDSGTTLHSDIHLDQTLAAHNDAHFDDHVDGEMGFTHDDHHGDSATGHTDHHSDYVRQYGDVHHDGDHLDNHLDIPAGHVDNHFDDASYTDVHHDGPGVGIHNDNHSDQVGSHLDTHQDDTSLGSHTNVYTGSHADTHGDTSHVDIHNDRTQNETVHIDVHLDHTDQLTQLRHDDHTDTVAEHQDHSDQDTLIRHTDQTEIGSHQDTTEQDMMSTHTDTDSYEQHQDHSDYFPVPRRQDTTSSVNNRGMILPTSLGGRSNSRISSEEWEDIPYAVIVRIDGNVYRTVSYQFNGRVSGVTGEVRLFNKDSQLPIGSVLSIDSQEPLPFVHDQVDTLVDISNYVLQARVTSTPTRRQGLYVWGSQANPGN